ncbi:MAG TPA: PQQ-binding-like beta-propeller repeat protein [Gaiellaceae bacterium]|nr:PQQ-binding-like beta-propeller repeat protein [Gaiellaceae bacterium]
MARPYAQSISLVFVAAAATGLLCSCGAHGARPDAATSAGTRASTGGAIDARSAARLRPLWRFTFRARPGYSGIFASTPVADRTTVYVQDLQSNVFALARTTGALRWSKSYRAPNDGPNGLAVDDRRVYGATDSDAFALSAATGRELWHRHLTSATEQLVDVAPVVWQGLVFVSTIGYPPGGRGAIYALDAATGAVRWKFVTVQEPWRYPAAAGGGGVWYPVSIDDEGRLYAGTANPTPWGGTPRRPNGAAFPGPVHYTDSLLVLDARTGRLLWQDQVTPHDVRDYDFQATPILTEADGAPLVIGAGKAGRVIAWDRSTRARRWSTPVGLHRNDVGALPAQRVTVCPGLLGGVETPMAYADGRVFVPVVDLCGWGSATGAQPLSEVDPSRGTGRFVALDAASGRVLWQRHLAAPDFGCAAVSNDVVFTSTYDGTVLGLAARDGRVVWRARLGAGVNACPAVVGDLVLFGAGVRRPGGGPAELVAFSPTGAS